MEYQDFEKLILVKKEKYYPQGANCPTYIETYSCPCSKGVVERRYIPGFDDDFSTLICKECEKKYNTPVDRGYYGFRFYLIKKQ